MIYEKYAIITKDYEESKKVIDLLREGTSIYMFRLLLENLILIDTTDGESDWEETIKEHLNINVKIMPIDEFLAIDNTPEEVLTESNRFIRDANISDDIDYFLEIVGRKCGAVYLSGKERQRLQELSGHPFN